MSEYTTIRIQKTTRENLKKLKITKREMYDEIIQRLIQKVNENEKNKK